MDKPHAPACDRNRDPILEVLRAHLPPWASVLEIGGGTGQHAVYFAAAFPLATWQTSDRADNLPGIRLWLAESALPNTPAPIALDVNGGWPTQRFDAIFTANTFHIMGWEDVVRCFERLPSVMNDDALLIVYGPFNYDGRFTSESNAAFDGRLRAVQPQQGIRDFDDVDALARVAGMTLVADHAMPANNRCIVWQRGQSRT